MIHNFSLLERLLLSNNVYPHPLLDSLTLTIAGRTLQVAVNIGLFDLLDRKDADLMTIAKALKISSEGALVLLNCLSAMGYIETNSGKYSLSKRSHTFFGTNSKRQMKSVVAFSEYISNSLSNMKATIVKGYPKSENLDIFSKGEWEIFNNAMAEIAKTSVDEVIKKIPISKNYTKLADLGGSHGLYSIEYCKKIPNLHGTIVDLPPTRKLAQENIASLGMSDRIRFQAADFMKEDIGTNLDVVFLINVIHGLNPHKNASLIKKIASRLNKGGIIVIVDQFTDIGGKSDLSKLLASTMGVMLFTQAGGRTYRTEEVIKWFYESGIGLEKLSRLRTPGNALLIGKR